MKSVGIICEFNPLHNGHIYFIKEVKKKFPNHVIILVLNGYFLQRGECSVLTKEDKTKLSLKYGVDIVTELPVVFGTQSADTFAKKSIEILNNFKIDKLVFGSECNDVTMLTMLAKKQINNSQYDELVKTNMKKGLNYPTSLAKSLNKEGFVFNPNDILGICYIKAILENNFNISVSTIKRTNDFHDNKLSNKIVSASNIRSRFLNKEDISIYLPENYTNEIVSLDKTNFFNILKVKILTTDSLNMILDVDEGIENKLKKEVIRADNIDEFIKMVKNKRFTYNKINRMFIHILLGIKKDISNIDLEYTKVLGVNKIGRKYLSYIKREVNIPLSVNKDSEIYKLELISSIIYDVLTGKNSYMYEKSNKTIIW